MNKLLFTLFAVLYLVVSANAQVISTYSGSLTASSPTFNRPDEGTPPTLLASGFTTTNFYYAVISVPVTTAGSYTFTTDNGFDNFGVLYNTSGFNPSSPLTNSIEANDDGSGAAGGFSITQTLAVGTYTLVVTSFRDLITGSFTVTSNGPAAVPLPLSLISFNGRSFAAYNNLEWSTGSEKATASFELQRSTDARDFRKIASIDTKGDGNNNYAFKDNNPAAGSSFYRLKMIDKDGQFTFSNTIQISAQQSYKAIATVTPNPAKGNIHVAVNNADLLGTQGTILNLSGQALQSFEVNSSNLEFNITPYPAGIYIIRFQSGDLIKFTKQD